MFPKAYDVYQNTSSPEIYLKRKIERKIIATHGNILPVSFLLPAHKAKRAWFCAFPHVPSWCQQRKRCLHLSLLPWTCQVANPLLFCLQCYKFTDSASRPCDARGQTAELTSANKMLVWWFLQKVAQQMSTIKPKLGSLILRLTSTSVPCFGSGLCVGSSSALFEGSSLSLLVLSSLLSAGFGVCFGATSGVSNVAGVASATKVILSMNVNPLSQQSDGPFVSLFPRNRFWVLKTYLRYFLRKEWTLCEEQNDLQIFGVDVGTFGPYFMCISLNLRTSLLCSASKYSFWASSFGKSGKKSLTMIFSTHCKNTSIGVFYYKSQTFQQNGVIKFSPRRYWTLFPARHLRLGTHFLQVSRDFWNSFPFRKSEIKIVPKRWKGGPDMNP